MNTIVVLSVGRSTYVSTRPLLIRHNNPINNLNAAQTTASACILQLLQYYPVQFLVVHQILKAIALDAIFASQFLERRFCRYNDGDGFLLVRGGVDADVGDNGSGAVDGFQLRRN